ncbi:MAG: MFS transporter [Candidatus Heimdallarchaeota archaeon]|nr:MAG: MFS transporter [Candidatus Heimdallarchaeota archaeon]
MEEKTRSLLQELFILLSGTLTVMAGATISPILKEMATFFHEIPNIGLVSQLVLSVTSLAIAVGALFIGFIIDKFGRKPVLVTTTVLYAIFGTMGFYILNIYVILASRIFLGFAVAGIMTSCTTLIGDYYSSEKRNQVLGFQSTLMSFGGALFIILGGALGNIAWNYAFLVYFLSLLILPGIIIFIPEPERDFEEENESIKPGDDAIEKKAGFPIKVGLLSYTLMFLTMVVFFFIPSQFSFYLASFAIESELLIGLAIATSGISAGIASFFYKYIKKALDTQLIFIINLIFIGSGFFLLAFAPVFWVVFVGTSLTSLGFGIFMPNINSWLLQHTPNHLRGRVVGLFTTMLYSGQFVSPLIAASIIPVINLSGRQGISGLLLIGGIVVFVLLIMPITLLLVNIIKNKKSIEDSIEISEI